MKKTIELPLFSSYEFNSNFDDELLNKNEEVRKIYKTLFKLFSEYSVTEFNSLNNRAKEAFFNNGITFQVYGSDDLQEKNKIKIQFTTRLL